MANARKKQVHTKAHYDEFDGFPKGAFEYDDASPTARRT
ncbi:hypothetical protein ABIA20_006585 [Sinorhizobium fredii]